MNTTHNHETEGANMGREPAAVREVSFPDLEAPTPEQWSRLRQWRRELAEALQRSVQRLAADGLALDVSEPEVVYELGNEASEARSPTVVIGEADRQWVLLAPPPACELLVAAALGLEQTSALAGAVDQAVYGLMADSLARAAGNSTGLSQGSGLYHLPAADACRGLVGPWLRYRIQLTRGAVGAELHLTGSWPAWRPVCGAATVAPRQDGLRVDDLASAAVAVEAILPGTQVSARDLLDLAVGDVIPLGTAAGRVELRLNERVVGVGRAGTRGQNLAVNVVRAYLTEAGESDDN